MINAYLGGPVQCTQGNLSICVYLCVFISQVWPSVMGMTNSSNAIDDGGESAKSLVIFSVDHT